MSYIFKTDRLTLRAFELSDAPRAQKIAGDRELAKTTFLPYPYSLEMAENWIEGHSQLIENGDAFPFAVILESDLIGTMTIRVDKTHNKGELAYWIGRDYWGKGYATEAASIVVDFSFNELNLHRVWAPIMSKNISSEKVMQKVGLKYEGTLKQDVLRWNKYEDVHVYGLLKCDYKKLKGTGGK